VWCAGVRSTQGTRVHVSLGLLCGDRDDAVDRADCLQDTSQLRIHTTAPVSIERLTSLFPNSQSQNNFVIFICCVK